MPTRRMFSNRIANSARFLQMPTESQLLYFHMVLRADDDGVVESYPLMKLLGMAPDNFKVLVAKGFIQQLNEDQVIIIIDWTEHNKIRADRKVNSIYLPLLMKECPELSILKPEPRVDVEDNSRRLDGGLSTDGIGKVKLSKVRLSKDKLSKAKYSGFATQTVREEVSFDKKIYDGIMAKYQSFRGIHLQGSELLPPAQEVKTMLIDGRQPKDIIACMEWMAEDSYYKNKWTMKTVRLKLPDFVAGKLRKSARAMVGKISSKDYNH